VAINHKAPSVIAAIVLGTRSAWTVNNADSITLQIPQGTIAASEPMNRCADRSHRPDTPSSDQPRPSSLAREHASQGHRTGIYNAATFIAR